MARKASSKSSKPAQPVDHDRDLSKPKLLSGGNPQIPKGDGDEFVHAYLQAMPGWKGNIGWQLDALIRKAVPHARTAVRWNTPFYGVEGQGWFVAFHCMTKYIKVTFFRGGELLPVPPIASKLPDVRYFHIHEHDPLDSKLLTAWIQQAAKLPGDKCF